MQLGWVVAAWAGTVDVAAPQQPPPEGAAWVWATGANVRAEPATTGSLLATLGAGTAVTVLADPAAAEGEWAHVRAAPLRDDQVLTRPAPELEGWMLRRYLSGAEPTPALVDGLAARGGTTEELLSLALLSFTLDPSPERAALLQSAAARAGQAEIDVAAERFPQLPWSVEIDRYEACNVAEPWTAPAIAPLGVTPFGDRRPMPAWPSRAACRPVVPLPPECRGPFVCGEDSSPEQCRVEEQAEDEQYAEIERAQADWHFLVRSGAEAEDLVHVRIGNPHPLRANVRVEVWLDGYAWRSACDGPAPHVPEPRSWSVSLPPLGVVDLWLDNPERHPTVGVNVGAASAPPISAWFEAHAGTSHGFRPIGERGALSWSELPGHPERPPGLVFLIEPGDTCPCGC
jgi:hypothetical protein